MRLIPLISILLMQLSLTACPGGDSLPAEPGLLNSSFGGVQLLMNRNDALDLAGSNNGIDIRVITTDEKQKVVGYDPALEIDEVVAIFYDAVPGLDDAGSLAGKISEIRCFVNRANASDLQLLGKSAATLGASDVEELLGPAANRSELGDGQIHLTYLFDPKVKGEKFQLKLVTSHHLDHSCYAFSISLIENP